MEKINSKKFKEISTQEMKKIEGGKWGWVAISATCTPNGGSTTHFHHYNIWGNYDGGYMNVAD